jgi:hypothetical protein
VVSVTDPYGRILGVLDRSRYFFLSSSSSGVLTRLSGSRSRPTTFSSGSAGNRTRASGSVAKSSDYKITEAVGRSGLYGEVKILNLAGTRTPTLLSSST